jgi:hypothetical protein
MDERRESRERSAWTLPALMYGAVMLGIVIEPLTASSVRVASRDGHVWWTGGIYTALALISLFTMLFVTVLALVRVGRSPLLHAHRPGHSF